MAGVADQPTTGEELLRNLAMRITTLERRRNGDGVQTLDGDCVFGGGSGGDGSYYGGNTDYPPYDFPDVSYPPYFPDWINDYLNQNPDFIGDWLNDPANQPWLNDYLNNPANQQWLQDYLNDNGYNPGGGGGAGSFTAGWNLYWSGDTLNFGVLSSDPGAGAPFGVLWWNDTGP